jgi:phosphomethylpyrimidine synthase
MTQLEAARRGIITPEMERVAEEEGYTPREIRDRVAEGSVVIPKNRCHTHCKATGIGKGLRVKVNANIGTSSDVVDVEEEMAKLKAALEAGTDAVMDLSTGGDLEAIRKKVINDSAVPVGTVPIYQAAIESRRKGQPVVEMSVDEIFGAIEKHAADGVDFVTVHCGVTKETVSRMEREGRVLGVVSRGGAFLIAWMKYNDRENPLYEYYDRLLGIALEYDVTLSLGDGFRPGCLSDATDRGQIQELLFIGELVQRAWDAGVQVMVEGPGHVPIDQIAANMAIQKRVCHGAPFYVLGPLVTDVAPGYDHIVSAIGGAIAAVHGADFICYVTPSEHLRLPTVEDVREGVMAARIAGHAADVVRGVPGAWEWDLEMGKARWDLDWERQIRLAMDPVKAKSLRETRLPREEEVCTMCGEFCAIKLLRG